MYTTKICTIFFCLFFNHINLIKINLINHNLLYNKVDITISSSMMKKKKKKKILTVTLTFLIDDALDVKDAVIPM